MENIESKAYNVAKSYAEDNGFDLDTLNSNQRDRMLNDALTRIRDVRY